MKLKNIFMCIAAITVLIGCSDDKEPILDKPVELAPTTMSICIDAEGTIVSKANTDQTITNMYVLIFKMNGDFYKMDKLNSAEGGDEIIEGGTIPGGNENTTAQNEDITVDTGNHLVLVLANVKNETQIKNKKLSEIQEEMTILSDEVDGNLTMSSEVMEVIFHANKENMIGYSAAMIDPETQVDIYPALKGGPVQLYRSVARVQLASISLSETAKDDNYGTPVSFKVSQIFMANVKGYSKLASKSNDKDAANYLTIETLKKPTNAAKELWRYGAWPEFTTGDVLKKITTEESLQDPDLAYTYNYVPEGADGRPEIEAGKTLSAAGTDGDKGLQMTYSIYENEIVYGDGGRNTEIGQQTLLIIKGDYTYTPKGATTNETLKDRYYAITINPTKEDQMSTSDLIREHTGIIRNTQYVIYATLNGPGSDRPYLPDARLWYNTQVYVAPWAAEIPIGGELN